MEEIKTKGGKRDGSGRRPSADPKKAITVYIAKSKIELNGGEGKMRDKIYGMVECDFNPNPVSERNNSFEDAAKSKDEDKANIDEVKRKVRNNNKPKNKARILKERNTVNDASKNAVYPLTNSGAEKHPLWKDGDPKEDSMAFHLKYGVFTYEELSKT